jgi:dihydrodipicolinate synthase/N-acetylneuraminate lyase
LPALMMGSPAFESGVANFFPELVMQFYTTAARGQYAEAIQLQEQMLQLRDISHLLGRNIPTLHALIQMRGIETRFPKRPFFALSDQDIQLLGERLRALPFPLPWVA